MKIAVIQASSQKDKNSLLYDSLVEVVKHKGHEVINFGIFEDEDVEYSYVEIAMLISILLGSKAVDFVVTGCSSGQGMMLACNSLPSVLCGYIENTSDAYLFGRINNGNAISIPLGLNFGWASEINVQCVLEKLFDGKKYFDFPKSIVFIRELIKLSNLQNNDIVLDFFSGSATTAHAVMQLNAEDGGKRKFIMVQLPEKCDEKSEAYKAGYKNICEIGKERIRRAGAKIRESEELRVKSGVGDNLHTPHSTLHTVDVGFRVLKLDSSNMQDVFYNPAAMAQSVLDTTIDNVKPDRTPMDLLFQVMLELGVQLSAKIEEKEVCGKKYFVVNGNEIIACFDDNINNDVITEIAKQQPLYAVFKDKSFATDSVGINNEQLFKTYSPITEVKVI